MANKNPFIIPGAIIIAGLVIGGAIIFGNVKEAGPQEKSSQNSPSPKFGSSAADNIKPVSEKDHILGDPKAPVKLVEFSDLECPFCKRFHPTMQQVMQEYGQDGRVAWVYRHFPLDSLHSKARKEAEATECAQELGGNAKFWEYVDRMFEITPSNDRLDLQKLPQIAQDVGLAREEFEICLESGKYGQHIEDDYQDAVKSGGRGTPYSVVIAQNGKKFPVSGAQPYSAVKAVIELALKEK